MRHLVWLLGLLVAVPAAAQDGGSAMSQAPAAAIEAQAPAAAPMAVRQGDAGRVAPPPAPPPLPTRTGPDGSTVQVGDDAPPPENDTARFLFRDVTERTSPPVKSLPERAAAVESLRQSLPNGAPRR